MVSYTFKRVNNYRPQGGQSIYLAMVLGTADKNVPIPISTLLNCPIDFSPEGMFIDGSSVGTNAGGASGLASPLTQTIQLSDKTGFTFGVDFAPGLTHQGNLGVFLGTTYKTRKAVLIPALDDISLTWVSSSQFPSVDELLIGLVNFPVGDHDFSADLPAQNNFYGVINTQAEVLAFTAASCHFIFLSAYNGSGAAIVVRATIGNLQVKIALAAGASFNQTIFSNGNLYFYMYQLSFDSYPAGFEFELSYF